jgi:hypothetical protein
VTDSILSPVVALAKSMQRTDVPVTRLATVQGGNSYSVTVKFDGETATSGKSYRKCYAPANIGDRVVMVRSGSTWVAMARIADSAFPADTGWLIPTMVNGWVNFAGGHVPCRYRKYNGTVYLQGLVMNGAGGIFTLPPGFRPGAILVTGAQSNAGFARIDVNPDGTVVYLTGGTAWLSLNQIAFPADQ